MASSYYVLGRIENLDETYSLSCDPFYNNIINGIAMSYEYNQQYKPNDLLKYQGIYYKCINDEFYEDINMSGYKIIQNESGLFQYAYVGYDGGIYADKMNTDFSDYPVYNSDGSLANEEDTSSYNVSFQHVVDIDGIESIFNGTSTEFSISAVPENNYVYRNDYYKTPEEKFVRILDSNKFNRIPVKGSEYSFIGSSSIYKTLDEKSGVVISSVNLEELNLNKCVIAVRFFNKNGEHITEFSNSEQLEPLKIGFFIEGIR